FISGVKHLDNLTIAGGKLQTLSGIEGCMTLRSLSVTSCMELKDMSAVTGLENLQELTLDMPYGCSEPKLDRLTGLKKLSLEQFHDCSFLEDMVNLTELHLTGCDIAEEIDLSNLTSLTTLSCTSYVGSPLEVDTIEKFKMLECLDLHGSVTYDDISGLFQMPRLRELNISGMQCEIDFDAIAENPVLEILYMDDMYLYENVHIDYNSGIVMIDWDKVTLDEHMDFLKKFPGLKELYLRENGLTDLSFAEGLPALQILDISENYITELRPLARLPSLQKVVCAGNPLKNEKVLMDSVLIITETE
ncbi:MAG: leucine-rich repeat domain-containing protein, partial [Lachnospiraceae bacterium]|nr:leucine-rich repeat domain-containing protein [Lachnospiraceae bacterium]